MDIKNIVAVITGGASGLGAATARLLAERGASIAILDFNEAAGKKIAEEVGGFYHPVDVTDDSTVKSALAASQEALGVARILVNCAGITMLGSTVEENGSAHRADVARKVIEVNLLGTFFVLTNFAARLAAAEPIGEERGVMINTASIAAYDGQTGMSAYAASKGGVVGLTLPMARDLAPRGIRVMTIAPGMFRTPMVGDLTDEQNDVLGRSVPFPNRLGRPEEYARLVASIIENSMLNGEVIRLDAAHRLPNSYVF